MVTEDEKKDESEMVVDCIIRSVGRQPNGKYNIPCS